MSGDAIDAVNAIAEEVCREVWNKRERQLVLCKYKAYQNPDIGTARTILTAALQVGTCEMKGLGAVIPEQDEGRTMSSLFAHLECRSQLQAGSTWFSKTARLHAGCQQAKLAHCMTTHDVLYQLA